MKNQFDTVCEGPLSLLPCARLLCPPQPAWRLSCNLTSTLSTCLLVDTHTPQFFHFSATVFFLSKPSTETLLPLFAVWPQGKSSSSSPPAIHLPGRCLPSCAARPSSHPPPIRATHPSSALPANLSLVLLWVGAIHLSQVLRNP